MPNLSFFAATARFAGRVGNQAAVSLVASAAAAACLALPSLMATPPERTATASEPMAWASPVAPDGKIRDRHHDAIGGDGVTQALAGRGLATPAAIIMPMNLGWTNPAAEQPPTIRAAAVQTPEAAPSMTRTAQALPPRRPLALAERPRALAEPAQVPPSEPLQLASASVGAEASDALRPPATILGRVVPTPVGYIGSTVSGAVGLVGAAGSWTVARAAALVPGL